jgi:ATP-dependent helicase HrpA
VTPGGARDNPRPVSPPPPAPIAAHPVPPITYPESLPVSARREEIARAIARTRWSSSAARPARARPRSCPRSRSNSGAAWAPAARGLIGHTQPRRIAASSVAKRIAEELNSPLGEVVGYKVRFQDRLQPGASVKLMTDGILLAETQTDPLLRAYDTLIIDEAHERSLNIDFLLGYLRQLLPRGPT